MNRGDLIEIQGPPASGKTHLLYHLVVTSISPAAVLDIQIGGWDKAAVIFDTDGSFNMLRLHELLLNRLGSFLRTDLSPDDVHLSLEDLARAALTKVHVFRPTSSAQLAASLLNLPKYHIEHLPDDEIGLIAVDSVSSFYWPDRFTVEQTNAGAGRGKSHVSSPLYHVLVSLQKIRASHGPVIVLTNWGLNPLIKPTRDSAPTTLYKQHLNPFPTLPQHIHPDAPNVSTSSIGVNSVNTWQPPITHHITLPFVPITPFVPGLSIGEVQEQETKYRREIVTQGEVVGIVRTSGSSRTGRFAFRIGDHELLVDSGLS